VWLFTEKKNRQNKAEGLPGWLWLNLDFLTGP
jgi:hypothetical protein